MLDSLNSAPPVRKSLEFVGDDSLVTMQGVQSCAPQLVNPCDEERYLIWENKMSPRPHTIVNRDGRRALGPLGAQCRDQETPDEDVPG